MKLTAPLERVLRVFLDDISARRYGYDLMKAARLASGTLYPMLARLQDEGLVTAEWEPQRDDTSGAGPQVLPANRRRHPRRPAGSRPGRERCPGTRPGPAGRARHAAASTGQRAMTGRLQAQRLAERLIRRACRYLPEDVRADRYREWTAELPAIRHDPGIGFPPRRAARAVRFAAGTIRTARRTPGAVRYLLPDNATAITAGVRLLICFGIAIIGGGALAAWPPRGGWIPLAITGGVAVWVFAVIQELTLAVWLVRLLRRDRRSRRRAR